MTLASLSRWFRKSLSRYLAASMNPSARRRMRTVDEIVAARRAEWSPPPMAPEIAELRPKIIKRRRQRKSTGPLIKRARLHCLARLKKEQGVTR